MAVQHFDLIDAGLAPDSDFADTAMDLDLLLIDKGVVHLEWIDYKIECELKEDVRHSEGLLVF